MPVTRPLSKALVIDTENYAGDFERDLCAYVTGQATADGYCREIVEAFGGDISHLGWWAENIAYETDEEHGEVPVSVVATPGWFTNGEGHIVERAFAETYNGLRSQFKDAAEAQIAKVQRMIDDEDYLPEPSMFSRDNIVPYLERLRAHEHRQPGLIETDPAFLSVAIFVAEFPPQEVWDEFVARTRDFATRYPEIVGASPELAEKIELTGFRRLEPEFSLSEEAAAAPATAPRLG